MSFETVANIIALVIIAILAAIHRHVHRASDSPPSEPD